MLTSYQVWASNVSMMVSEKEGGLRIEFECEDPLFVKDATLTQSYSLLKITFPDEFTLKQLSATKLIQKINKKEKSLYLNIDDLNSYTTIQLASPPRLVIDANTKEPIKIKDVKRGVVSVVIIDPGHGGQDTGLLANGKTESSSVLEIALGFQDILKSLKYKAVYTRNADRFVSMEDRLLEPSKQKGYVFISIHISRTNKCVIYTSKFPTSPNGALNISGNDLYNTHYSQTAFLDVSKQLSETIGSAVKDGLGIEVRYLPMPITLLSEISAPSIMIELPYDFLLNKDVERNKKMISSIIKGIEKFAKD